MPWSKLNFGKHSGKTLPQIVFRDPDWFFWAVENNLFRDKGRLSREAVEIDARARSIRIPNNSAGGLEAEYFVHVPTGKFGRMQIVPSARPPHEGSSPTFRKNVIDLSVAHNIASYDKLGSKNLISSVKSALFGSPTTRMSRVRCETFFDDPANFVL